MSMPVLGGWEKGLFDSGPLVVHLKRRPSTPHYSSSCLPYLSLSLEQFCNILSASSLNTVAFEPADHCS